jgi:hypothetical protein
VVRGFARECGAHLLDHDEVDAWMRRRPAPGNNGRRPVTVD